MSMIARQHKLKYGDFFHLQKATGETLSRLREKPVNILCS